MAERARESVQNVQMDDLKERANQMATGATRNLQVAADRAKAASASTSSGEAPSWAREVGQQVGAMAGKLPPATVSMQQVSAAAESARGSVVAAASSAQSGAAAAASAAKQKALSVKASADAMAVSREKVVGFLSMFCCGSVVMSISTSFLPLLAVAPTKFAVLFALGSGLMMASIAMLKGPVEFVKAQLGNKLKAPFFGAYVISFVGTLVAVAIKSYPLTLFFALVQVASLAYFFCSYVPGGPRALTFVAKFVGRGCKKLVSG